MSDLPPGKSILPECIPFLKLPVAVDLPAILRDLDHCLSHDWGEHFNKQDYDGSWKVIALRSPNGQSIAAYAQGDHFQDTPLMMGCPEIQAFLNQFHCEFEAIRLLRLAPGSQIKTHADPDLSYVEGTFRLHVPLVTHPEITFTIAEQTIHFPAGECWYGNFSLPHSVSNPTEHDRIHLVVDAKRNDWTDVLFAQAGMDIENEDLAISSKQKDQPWESIAREFERWGTEQGMQMAAEVRQNQGPPRG